METTSQLGSRFTTVFLLVTQARILGDLGKVVSSKVSFSNCNVQLQVVPTHSVAVSRTGTGRFFTSVSSQ